MQYNTIQLKVRVINQIRERKFLKLKGLLEWRRTAWKHTHPSAWQPERACAEKNSNQIPWLLWCIFLLWPWGPLGYVVLLFWGEGIWKVVNPRNWNINSLSTHTVHDVMMWNTNSKITKPWHKKTNKQKETWQYQRRAEGNRDKEKLDMQKKINAYILKKKKTNTWALHRD